MGITLVQHADPQPDWPEFGFTFDGHPVRLRDVEEMFPPGDERGSVYYWHPTKPGVRVWPWKNSGYYVDDDGEVLTGAGPAPMSLAHLRSLGLTDEQIFSEHRAYYPESPVQPEGDPDSLDAQHLRRRVFDEVTAAWYAEPPMPRRG